DATGDWWGSDKGPGGDGPGFGDAVIAPDHNVHFTPWATAQLGADNGNENTDNSNTPRGLRELLIQDLTTLQSQVKGHLRHFIKDAIANFKATLNPTLWIDDSHLAAGAGIELFVLDRKAVHQLRHIVKGLRRSGVPAGLNETIQRAANLERMMAMIAI